MKTASSEHAAFAITSEDALTCQKTHMSSETTASQTRITLKCSSKNTRISNPGLVSGLCAGTVSEAVDPVVAEVHPEEGEPPGPGRVPGQLHQAEPVPHVHVRGQLAASHHQPEGATDRELRQITSTRSSFV